MAQLSETWQPRQLLQSFCSQAASVSVLNLNRSSTSGEPTALQVLLSLHGDSLCCSLLPASAAAAAAAEIDLTSSLAAQSGADGAHQPSLPRYLERRFWGPLKLTDEGIDEGVAAFAACELRGSEMHVDTDGDSGLLLTCGASGLMRLMLLRLRHHHQDKQEEQNEQRDSSLQIAEQRLGGFSPNGDDSSSKPWAGLQLLQKWKGTSSVARVATISNLLLCFPPEATSYSAKQTPTATAATATVGRLAAVGCVGGELEVLLLQQRTALRCTSLKHSAAIAVLRFHPSRALLAVGTADGLVCVYDLSFAAVAAAKMGAPAAPEYIPCISLRDHLSSITALTFIPEAACASLQQHKTGITGATRRGAASSEKHFADGLVSAASDSLVNVWSLSAMPDTAGQLLLPKEQEDLQQHLQGAKKNTLRLQKRLQQQQQVLLLQMPTLEIITSLLYDENAHVCPAGSNTLPLLVTGGAQGLVKLWNLKEKQVVKVLRTATALSADCQVKQGSEEDLGAFIRSLLWLPANSSGKRDSTKHTLLIAQDSGLISLLPPLSGLSCLLASDIDGERTSSTKFKSIRAVNATKPEYLLGRLESVFFCRFIPQPPVTCSCCCCQSRRTKASSESGGLGFSPLGGVRSAGVEATSQRKIEGHDAAVSCCDVSKNGCWIVTGARDGSLCVWHAASNRLIAKVPDAHAGCLTAVAFQRKSWGISPAYPHQLLFASCCDQNSIKIWCLPIPSSQFHSAEPSGAAGGEPQAFAAFETARGARKIECLASIVAHTKEINDLKFAPNDSFVATASQDKTCRLFAFPSLATKGELRGHKRGVHEIQFATREQTAATASSDATIRLWNLKTMSCIKTLQGDGVGFLCLKFLSLDSQIMSFNSNGEAQIWNCRTAECTATMQPVHLDKVWCFDLWGEALASAGADGQVCIWRDATAEVKAATKLKALREQQELAAAQTLEATGKTEEVLGLFLRLKKKYALAAFIQRRLLRSLAVSLDAHEPAALLRKGDTATLVSLLTKQQQQRLLSQIPPSQHQQLQPPQQENEEDWGAIISRLGEKEAKTLLGFVAEWSVAEPVTAAAAGGLLHLLLRQIPLELLLGDSESSNSKSNRGREGIETDVLRVGRKAMIGGKAADEVLKALVLNSQRHERRLIGLLQKSYLLDLLLPGAAGVQHEIEQLLLPLEQQKTTKRESKAQNGGVKANKKQKVQRDSKQHFVLDPDVLQPHYGSDFTQRCLYGES